MITRALPGRSVGQVLRWLYGPRSDGAVPGARLVASWDGVSTAVEPAVTVETGRVDTAGLTRVLLAPVDGCERVPARFVYHLVLRTAAGDRWLCDVEWAQVATAAMDATGIAPDGDSGGCRWVAVCTGEVEVHVVATLARQDGRAPQLRSDYATLARVTGDCEVRFGLRPPAGAGRSL